MAVTEIPQLNPELQDGGLPWDGMQLYAARERIPVTTVSPEEDPDGIGYMRLPLVTIETIQS